MHVAPIMEGRIRQAGRQPTEIDLFKKRSQSMGFELDIFQDPQLQSEFIEWLVDEQAISAQSHF